MFFYPIQNFKLNSKNKLDPEETIKVDSYNHFEQKYSLDKEKRDKINKKNCKMIFPLPSSNAEMSAARDIKREKRFGVKIYFDFGIDFNNSLLEKKSKKSGKNEIKEKNPKNSVCKHVAECFSPTEQSEELALREESKNYNHRENKVEDRKIIERGLNLKDWLIEVIKKKSYKIARIIGHKGVANFRWENLSSGQQEFKQVNDRDTMQGVLIKYPQKLDGFKENEDQRRQVATNKVIQSEKRMGEANNLPKKIEDHKHQQNKVQIISTQQSGEQRYCNPSRRWSIVKNFVTLHFRKAIQFLTKRRVNNNLKERSAEITKSCGQKQTDERNRFQNIFNYIQNNDLMLFQNIREKSTTDKISRIFPQGHDVIFCGYKEEKIELYLKFNSDFISSFHIFNDCILTKKEVFFIKELCLNRILKKSEKIDSYAKLISFLNSFNYKYTFVQIKPFPIIFCRLSPSEIENLELHFYIEE